MGIHEGENVETNTDSQQEKSLWRKRKSMKRDELILLITKNDWNPFERVTPSVLKILHEKHIKREDALL